MNDMLLYAPMAETEDGQRLFLYDNCLTLEEAVKSFEFWEKEYQYNLKRCWVDVFNGSEKVDTIDYVKAWVPKEKR